MIADNNNLSVPTQSTPILPDPSGLLTLTNLRVKRSARVRVEDQINLTSSTLEVSSSGELTLGGPVIASTINVTDGSVITHLATTASAFFKVDLSANTLAVDSTSKIDVTGRGFLGANQPGSPFSSTGTTVGFVAGSTNRNGGNYGGQGGIAVSGSVNPVYGDFRDPNDVGSGGGEFFGPGGNGGGLIRIVAQTLQLDGVITVDGENAPSSNNGGGGGGSGGGIRINVGTLSGTGTINANGGNGGPNGGGGGGAGGGRIAVYYESLAGFDLATQVVAAAGLGGAAGISDGQDGSVFTQQQIFIGWAPSDGDYPIMKAEAQVDAPIQLASLDLMPVGSNAIFTNFEDDLLLTIDDPHSVDQLSLTIDQSSPLLALKQLISNMQSQMPNTSLPQGRVFSHQSKIQNPKSKINVNRYLTLAAAMADDDFDPDPIYIYDSNGNRISMIDPTGLTTYNYDVLNRLTSMNNNEGLTTNFTYDALGRRTSMTHDNGVVTNYTYDAASQLLSLVHQLGATTINSFTYTYDKIGNRKTKADNSGTANYTYDALNRLVEATNPLPSNPLEEFTYDEVGNRVDSNQNGTSTFNNANQLEADSDFTYSYDNNGNLTQKTDKVTGAFTLYEYDAENKLIRVVREDGSIVNYKYDGLNRRIEKEVDSVVTQYIYDNEDILLELDGSNNIVARYTHGLGIDEPLILEKTGSSFFYHADGLGSITELTDTAGTVAQAYTYSSFGKIESEQNPTFDQPYNFTAREFDPETELYFYRARAYNPSTGRFLQEDPLGLFGGNANLYPYVTNNPQKFIDPEGLSQVVIDIRRTTSTKTSTTGTLSVGPTGVGYTLELPDRNNQQFISQIPAGSYLAQVSYSKKFGYNVIRLLNVPGREGVVIHRGNDPDDTQGCILPGKTVEQNRVGKSKNALDELLRIIKLAQTLDRAVGDQTDIIVNIK